MNTVLASDRQRNNGIGVTYNPFLTINNITYRGYMDGKDVANAVCASFAKQPKGCKKMTQNDTATAVN